MPKPLVDASQLGGLIGNLAANSPLVAAGQAIAKVGATAQDLADRAQKALTPAPAKPKGDIVLPRDPIGNLGKFAHPPRKGK